MALSAALEGRHAGNQPTIGIARARRLWFLRKRTRGAGGVVISPLGSLVTGGSEHNLFFPFLSNIGLCDAIPNPDNNAI